MPGLHLAPAPSALQQQSPVGVGELLEYILVDLPRGGAVLGVFPHPLVLLPLLPLLLEGLGLPLPAFGFGSGGEPGASNSVFCDCNFDLCLLLLDLFLVAFLSGQGVTTFSRPASRSSSSSNSACRFTISLRR